MNQSACMAPIFFRKAGMRQVEFRAFPRFENEQDSEVNHSPRGVQPGSGRQEKELFVSIPAGEPLRKQNLPEGLRSAFLQQLRRYAMRKPLRAELRIENLPERHNRLAVARKNVISLIAVRQNPPRKHRDHPPCLRFTVPWNAE